MSFPRYPKYKDSGVEWLGQVPEHWEVKQLGYLCSKIGSGKTPSGGAEIYTDEGIVFLRSQNIYDEGLFLDDVVYITKEIDEDLRASRILAGDILLNITGASLGRTCLVPKELPQANVNQHVCIIRLNELASREYIAQSMKSGWVRAQIANAQTGAAREGLNFAQISMLVLTIPPLPEQTAIAAFLDRETGKIDGLVAEQRRLMELLKEKRQAVISHAVTKGLNPHAPLKPSGLEWLGDVPAHWEVTRLSRLATKIGDGLHGTPAYVDESPFRFINGNNLVDGSIALTEATRCVSEIEFEKHRVEMNQTTVLLSINGTIGNLAFYHGESVMLGKSAAYVNCGEYLNREYLCLHLQSSFIRRYFDHSVTGTTISNLSLESVRRLPVALPPADEQQAIVAYLDIELAKLDTLTAEAQRAIDLLQERRTALISAAVTGQIDVRPGAPVSKPALRER